MATPTEADTSVPPTAVRRCRTARGLASRLLSADQDAASNGSADSEDCHIYSHRVANMFKNQPMGPYTGVSSTYQTGEKRKANEKNSPETTAEAYQSPVKSCSIVATHISSSDELSQELKDPTPPPTPKSDSKKRLRTMKRDIRKAVTRLEKIQKYLDKNDEVIFVDEVSPRRSSPTKDRVTDVKFKTRSGIIRHGMKPCDRFGDAMSIVAASEGVGENDIIMFINDRTIQPYESLQSLGITVADIIECHIRGEDSSSGADVDPSVHSPADITLILQTKDAKAKKCTLTIGKDEPMEKLMRQYCKKMHIRYGSVQFQFDGEEIDPVSTPEMMELESDYCIDVLTS